jgi:hypothetical protein
MSIALHPARIPTANSVYWQGRFPPLLGQWNTAVTINYLDLASITYAIWKRSAIFNLNKLANLEILGDFIIYCLHSSQKSVAISFIHYYTRCVELRLFLSSEFISLSETESTDQQVENMFFCAAKYPTH